MHIEDMTVEQMASLTEAQIREIVDLKCAEDGVKMIPDAPVEPSVLPPGKDTTAYQLGAMLFLLQEDAVEVAKFAMDRSLVSLEQIPPRYDYVLGERDVEVVPTATQHYSRKVYAERDHQIARAKEEKDRYDSEKREWDTCMRARANISSMIQVNVNNARRMIAERQKFDNLFSQYVGIAKGDHEMAIVFLKKAYPSWPDGWEPKGFAAVGENAAEGVTFASAAASCPAVEEVPF